MKHKTYTEAYVAAQTLKRQHSGDGIMVKIEKSPYGGFRTKLVPVDILIDNLTNALPYGKSKEAAFCE
ncbi:MAG: hypothetical protein KGZ88_11990 [Methylomicrobium sp.]|nr:hypothetical protein [Methylomicrobium sp.]